MAPPSYDQNWTFKNGDLVVFPAGMGSAVGTITGVSHGKVTIYWAEDNYTETRSSRGVYPVGWEEEYHRQWRAWHASQTAAK